MKVLDKLEKRPISEPFRQAAKYDSDYYSGYIEKPKKPMDFSIIKKKIIDGHYNTIIEFGNDVRLVFSNAQQSYTPDNPVHMMAHELSDFFSRMWNEYPKTEYEYWYANIKKFQKKIKLLAQTSPIQRELLTEPKGGNTQRTK